VTIQPGDQAAAGAGGRGHLRASHADREQVIGALKAAFVQGMLAKDEFDLRVGQAFASRTYADLAAVTADLPASLAEAQPPKPARRRGEARAPRLGRALAVGTVLYAGVWPLAFALPVNGPDHDPHAGATLLWLATFSYLFFALVFGAQILSDWLDKRSGRQLPRGPAPGAGGQAFRRPPSAGHRSLRAPDKSAPSARPADGARATPDCDLPWLARRLSEGWPAPEVART
jgi:hypothetical protein